MDNAMKFYGDILPFGQDFYQTYARSTGNQGLAQIFLGPFSAINTRKQAENLQRGPLLFFCAKVGLHETLVIVPSEPFLFPQETKLESA